MSSVEEILRQFSEHGVESAFEVESHRYQVFAYRSPGGRKGPNVRWKLYELEDGGTMRGLTFGMAEGAREAVEEAMRSAKEHARLGRLAAGRTTVSFRPSPQD